MVVIHVFIARVGFLIFTWSVGASVTLVWFWVGAGMGVVVVTLVSGLAVVGVSLRMSS